MKQKRIIITGTHHTPAIETIKQLEEDKQFRWSIYYLCDTFPKDKIDIELIHIPCGKYDRNSILRSFLQLPKILLGFVKSLFIIAKIKPDLVLSFGGYVSVPVVLASKIFQIPSITHEQTLTISLATKINSLFVNKIALSFPIRTTNPKFVLTGNILRRQIFDTKSKTFSHIDKPFIYVTGGNQGSVFLNSLLKNILPKLNQFSIVHQTGSLEFTQYKALQNSKYFPCEYISQNDIGWVLNNSEIIISRAGANTCQEIAALNKKAILIPLPNTQQNEQLLNAKWLESVNPNIVVITQENATPQSVLNAIRKLYLQKNKNNKTINKTPHPLITLIHETI